MWPVFVGFSDAPNGYGIDFGVTDDGRTLLIEVNDGYALGSYGTMQYCVLGWYNIKNRGDKKGV